MPFTLLLCRACCCGTREKHPELDHEAQARALQAAAEAGGGRLVISRCLNACERSNVAVLRSGAQTWWLGRLLRHARTEALCAWLREGGPDAGPLPAGLALCLFTPSEEASACAVREAQAR